MEEGMFQSQIICHTFLCKFSNGIMGHTQGIGVILCPFLNCSIIYPVEPVYYCSGHPSNPISLGSLKFYAGFQKVTSETLEHCDFVDPQDCSWRSPFQTQYNQDYFQIRIVKVNPQGNRNIVSLSFCSLSKTIS